MTFEQARQAAAHWIDSWNRHDLDAVLSHYADNFTMTTLVIQKLPNIPSGTLQGKPPVGDYWCTALRKIPDLKFSIIETTCGVDTVSIYYHAGLGHRAIETFYFNANGHAQQMQYSLCFPFMSARPQTLFPFAAS